MKRFVACSIVVAAIGVGRPSLAADEALESERMGGAASETSWELGAKASYLSPPISGGTNPFGAGFGARLGLSLGHVYIGASFIDYLGGQDVDLTEHGIMYGGELGYQFRRSLGGATTLTLRPSVGVGGMTLFYTSPNTSTSSTTTNSNPTGSSTTRFRSQPVDVISTASSSSGTGSGSTLSDIFGSSNADSTTTTTTAIYVQPGVTLLLSSSWTFAAVKASATWIPSVSDGLGGSAAWLMWGLEGELGVHW